LPDIFACILTFFFEACINFCLFSPPFFCRSSTCSLLLGRFVFFGPMEEMRRFTLSLSRPLICFLSERCIGEVRGPSRKRQASRRIFFLFRFSHSSSTSGCAAVLSLFCYIPRKLPGSFLNFFLDAWNGTNFSVLSRVVFPSVSSHSDFIFLSLSLSPGPARRVFFAISTSFPLRPPDWGSVLIRLSVLVFFFFCIFLS